MGNLRSDLRAAVSEFKVKNGLIETLTSEAYERVVSSCKYAAERGESQIKGLRIIFNGCRGGNAEYVTEVAGRIGSRLQKEDLTYDFGRDSGDYTIDIRW